MGCVPSLSLSGNHSTLSRLRNAGEESGFYGAVEGWISPATHSGSIGGRTPPPTVRSGGLCSPAFRKVGSLLNFDKQLGVLHRRHSHWPGRKRSVVRTTACLAIWLLKTTATRMRDRKPVERSGVADPISERWGRPYITYVEVCLGHICVAVVVCGEEMCSSTFCLVTVVRQVAELVEVHQPIGKCFPVLQ